MKTKVLLLVLLTIFISCYDDSDECIGFRPENVTEVNAPISGKINELVEIEVNFIVYNGCGQFEKFIESGSEKSKIIEVQAKYEGCICPTVIKEKAAVYEFTPRSSGEFDLKFKSGETDYITVNITITD